MDRFINPPESELQQVGDKLALPQEAIDGYLANATNPALDNCGECFWLRRDGAFADLVKVIHVARCWIVQSTSK